MLTKVRVLNTRWRYSVNRQEENGNWYKHEAVFEVLEVDSSDRLGIFITSKSTTKYQSEPDLSTLDELDLDLLDELVGKGFVRELKDEPPPVPVSKDGETFSVLTLLGAVACFITGAIVLGCGLSVHHGRYGWEAAIGAGLMVGGTLAVALRRD